MTGRDASRQADGDGQVIESCMPVYQPFSKRLRQQRGDFPQVFQTDSISLELAAHIRRIFYNLVGEGFNGNWAHQLIGQTLYTEYPHRFSRQTKFGDIPKLILDASQIDDIFFLDLIEMAVKVNYSCKTPGQKNIVPPKGGFIINLPYTLDENLNDLNYRFRECGYGYQIENNELIPIDSTYTHSEAVKPALVLLSTEGFNSALEEFYSAFEAYKRGDYRDAVKKCGDALDSTMKTIFAKLSWTEPNSGNFAPYVREAIKNNLLPSHMETQYNHIAGMIISGPGTFRNNEGGHGKGPNEPEAPDYFARYMINMTASSILFLIHAYQAKRTELISHPNP